MNATGRSPLEEAMEFFTIPVLAKELNPDWKPPRRGTSCRAPYRADHSPSFSIFAGGGSPAISRKDAQ